MPKKVYNNVEGHRVIDNKRTVEDVTKVGLPTVKHPTTEISKVSGMAMDINMPDGTRLEAMEFAIYHNNGVNCHRLTDPDKHTFEFRVVRQRYNVTKAIMEHESVKYRIIGFHVSTEKGDVEMGNPLGSTEKYSVLRYEEEVNGKVTIVADATAGLLKFNGKDYTNVIESMLK